MTVQTVDTNTGPSGAVVAWTLHGAPYLSLTSSYSYDALGRQAE